MSNYKGVVSKIEKVIPIDKADEVLKDPTVPYQYYVNPIWEDIEIKQ